SCRTSSTNTRVGPTISACRPTATRRGPRSRPLQRLRLPRRPRLPSQRLLLRRRQVRPPPRRTPRRIRTPEVLQRDLRVASQEVTAHSRGARSALRCPRALCHIQLTNEAEYVTEPQETCNTKALHLTRANANPH